MIIGYKDFLPGVLKSGFFATEHEALPVALARANEWIVQSAVEVLNVGTVVLPNIASVEAASQVGLRTSGELSSHWHQMVRMWYAVPPPGNPTGNSD